MQEPLLREQASQLLKLPVAKDGGSSIIRRTATTVRTHGTLLFRMMTAPSSIAMSSVPNAILNNSYGDSEVSVINATFIQRFELKMQTPYFIGELIS